jgi:hypothetical protein
MPTRAQWLLGIIPLAVIVYFVLNHDQFFRFYIGSSRVRESRRPSITDGFAVRGVEKASIIAGMTPVRT